MLERFPTSKPMRDRGTRASPHFLLSFHGDSGRPLDFILTLYHVRSSLQVELRRNSGSSSLTPNALGGYMAWKRK